MERTIDKSMGYGESVASGGDDADNHAPKGFGVDRGDGVIESDRPPTLYESDYYTLPWEENYYAGEKIEKEEEGQVVDLSKDSYFIAHFGPKRSGKSLLMVFWIAKAMGLWQMPVWSNIPIKFIWHDRHGKERLCESLPLDPVSLATSKDYSHGIACIDELPLYLNSKNAMTTKNKVLGLILQQMGKRKLSFLTTAQNPKSIDGITSWQMDLGIFCADASKKYPQQHLERGKTILFSIADYSGQWTGVPYEESGELQGGYKLTQANKLWTVYKSYEEVDILESLRLWDVDLRPTKITDKEKVEDYSNKLLGIVSDLKRSGVLKVKSDDLYASLGVGDPAARRKYGSLLKSWGVTRGQVADGNHVYNLADFELD